MMVAIVIFALTFVVKFPPKHQRTEGDHRAVTTYIGISGRYLFDKQNYIAYRYVTVIILSECCFE